MPVGASGIGRQLAAIKGGEIRRAADTSTHLELASASHRGAAASLLVLISQSSWRLQVYKCKPLARVWCLAVGTLHHGVSDRDKHAP